MANCCIGGCWFTLAQFLGFIIVVSQNSKNWLSYMTTVLNFFENVKLRAHKTNPIQLVGRIQRTQKDPDIKYDYKLHQMWCNCLLLKEPKRTNRQCFSGTFGDSHLALKGLCLELDISWRLSKPPCLHPGFNGCIACVLYKAPTKMKAPMLVCSKGSNEDEGMGTLTVNKVICKKKPKPYNLPRWYC